VIRTIAILGAGHGGCAAAADLTRRGFDVRLQARNPERLAPLREVGGVDVRGVQQGFVPRDFRAWGLSLEKMGLADRPRETLPAFLENGS
jgi:2-polyprenyl-6-methoxyphenol hydroxylase-like FAD-dependent oxidoreductase